MCVLSKRGSFIPHACLEFRTTLKRYFSIGLRRKFTPGVLRTYVCKSIRVFFLSYEYFVHMYEWVLWNKSYTSVIIFYMKIIFFFGTKISKKKLGENILWHTHITSLYLQKFDTCDLSWFIVNYCECRHCTFLWILVVSCDFKGVKCPWPNRKTQETTRNHKFYAH